jgi:hypothetical protein
MPSRSFLIFVWAQLRANVDLGRHPIEQAGLAPLRRGDSPSRFRPGDGIGRRHSTG